MEPVDKNAFAQRLRARLKKLGWSQTQLAKKLGLRQQTINNCLTGKVERPGFINEMAEVMGTTAKWLQYGKGKEEIFTPVTPEQVMKIVYDLDVEELRETMRFVTTLKKRKFDASA